MGGRSHLGCPHHRHQLRTDKLDGCDLLLERSGDILETFETYNDGHACRCQLLRGHAHGGGLGLRVTGLYITIRDTDNRRALRHRQAEEILKSNEGEITVAAHAHIIVTSFHDISVAVCQLARKAHEKEGGR